MSTQTPHYVYWIKDGRLGVAQINDKKIDDIKNVNLTGKTIRFHYVKRPSDLTMSDLNSSFPDIPKVLHDGLINRDLEKLSIKVGNIQLAQYYKAEWLSCLRNAKRIKNQNKDGSSYNINQHEY